MKFNLFMKASLVAVVGLGLSGVFYQHAGDFMNFSGMSHWTNKLEHMDYKTFSETVALQGVTEVDVMTVNAGVDLHQRNVTMGKVDFTSGVDQKTAMQMQVEDHVLKVKVQGQSGYDASVVDLVLPASVQVVKILSESGDVKIDKGGFKDVSVNTVKGDIHLQDVNSDDVGLKSVSGDIYWVGDGSKWDVSSVSGDVRLKSAALTPQGNIQTVSGDVDLDFVNPVNAEIDVKSISGKVEMGKTIMVGRMAGLVKIRSVSGDVKVGH